MSMFGANYDLAVTGSYPTVPQVVLPFTPNEVAFQNKSPVATMFVSFDGVADDIELVAGSISEGKVTRTRAMKFWLRALPAGTPPVVMRVEASTDL